MAVFADLLRAHNLPLVVDGEGAAALNAKVRHSSIAEQEYGLTSQPVRGSDGLIMIVYSMGHAAPIRLQSPHIHGDAVAPQHGMNCHLHRIRMRHFGTTNHGSCVIDSKSNTGVATCERRQR